ncbi:purine-cytosine permease-like protein [Conyzicola lurida]|uniref:Purine-cytosine permease-like protein n=1 Tax=Conyzicola lurida TaxID=1172621 RepID=A0A841ANM6_9MICO|nr:cytosine permease [Conyzicola lurida]MBB5843306.1 purine-cytosine permease-like protein [Conyzicola lurida]
MSTTDDARDRDPLGDPPAESDEEIFAPPRLRRSTYTPPPQYRDLIVEPEPEPVDDDEPAAFADPFTVPVEPPIEQPVAPPVETGDLPSDWAPPTSDTGSWQQAPPPSFWAPPAAPAENIFAMPAAEPAPEVPAEPSTSGDAEADESPEAATHAPWSLDDVPVVDEAVANPFSAVPDETPAAETTTDARYRPWTPPTDDSWRAATWEDLFPATPRPDADTDEAAPVDSVVPDAAPATRAPDPTVDDAPGDETAAEPAAESESESEAEPESESESESVSVSVSEVEAEAEAAPEPDAATMSDDEAAAALAMQAPPAGQPWIPQRRSLPDDVLFETLDAADQQPGGTLSAIDALENEMRLREEELQEYRDWEDSMLAVGTPEALAVIEQVRPEFSAIVIPAELEPTPTQQIAIVDAAALAAAEAEAARAADTVADAEAVASSDDTDQDSDETGPGFPHPEDVPATPVTPWEPSPLEVPAPAVPELPESPVTPELPETPPTPEIPDLPEAPLQAPDAPTTPDVPAAPEPTTAPAPFEPAPSQPTPSEPVDIVREIPLSSFAPPALVEPVVVDPTPTAGTPVLLENLFQLDDTAHEKPAEADATTEGPVEPAAPASAAFGFPPATPAASSTPDPHFDSLLSGPADEAILAEATATPSAPTAAPLDTARQDTAPVLPAEPVRLPLFSLEQSGLAPTPVEYRVGRAARLFWLWFAANSSIVGIAFGAVIFSLGMSLRQSIVAALAGVAISFIPLGLGTLAGKRSGQPTVVVSRAAFGVAGNIVPAALAVVSRVFWGAVLLWLFATSIAATVGPTGSTSGLAIVFIAIGVMVAGLVAFLGYTLLARVQLVVSIVSTLLIVGFVALTASRVDVQTALTVDDGPWILVLTGTVLVFSFVGLVWANSSSDLARYQRPGGSGGGNMLWATFGATLPTFLLIAYGALLAASDPALATALVSSPIDALTELLPTWYSIPLMVAVALSLFSAVIITVYSGAFALQGVGLRLERQWAVLFAGALIALGAAVFTVLDVDFADLFRDLATTLAVPVAAWAGIFAADTIIRNRPFHTESLLAPGGVYPRVNWINLPALVVITVIGWGLTTATAAGLGWQGYGFALAGVPLAGDLASSDLGVVVALLLGILTPLVSGIPAIRRQEAAARKI